MARTLFTNVSIYDGKGKKPFAGEVAVEGNRIQKVAKGARGLPRDGATVVDGDGATLMPGLVNAHCHMSFTGPQSMSEIPPEEHTLITMRNAKTILDHGVTAAVGAGAAKPRLDIVIRNEINAGLIPGPRYRAATPEITVTGGLGDQRMMHYYKNDLSLFADGPEEIRRAVRELIREGVDIVKLMPSGDHLIVGACDAEQTAMDEDEIAAGARVAHSRGRRLAAHARNPESIRLCVKYGIELIYHATYADEESLDLLEEHKDKHWVVPAIGFTHATAYEAADFGITPEDAASWGFIRELEIGAETLKKMHARGIKVLPFGDYGFPWTPHGSMTRDFEHFTNYLGMKPHEILRSATQYGAEAFAAPDELGQVKAGYLADLLLIDGDPFKDLTLFQDEDNILMIMKDGEYHKAPQPRQAMAHQAAAE
jgi:imidazolonepropionase-like amidohydrolase